MQSIRNHGNDRRAHDTPGAAMTMDGRLADGATHTHSHDASRTVVVGKTAQRLREANERAFRSAERPWGRGWFSRFFSRDKTGD